jgi:two-component system, chemotaxis family, CheB/CheR fusion protein
MAQRKSKKKAKAPRSAARPLEEFQARHSPKRAAGERADQFPIVAVGASAGGVEAFEAFFRPFPANTGMAFVVLTHLDPRRESLLPSIIGRWTAMPVVQVSDGDRVIADKIFVIPSNAVMTIAHGQLKIRKRSNNAERLPLDTFFSALAEDQGPRAVAVVLSGSGSDGSLGIKAVKERGGLTLAQGSDGTEAAFKEMPESAAATGLVDLVLPVQEMPERLLRFVRDGGHLQETPEAKSVRDAADLRQIYSLVRSRVGHDFSRYKERTFLRRVQRRMQVLQLSQLRDYVKHLRQDHNEATLLFRDLLIGVTNFFRDRDAFATLAKFMPRLFEGKGADDTVRVWVAACATGEEAYSLAILLREYADGIDGAPKIQVFASDIDENALAIARTARYPAILVRDIPPARLNRFFTREGASYHVVKELRDLCVFSAHSLIRDPPFSRLDLVSCRNLLIYLNTDLQAQIIPLFHYALKPNGMLFLGTSENVSRHADLFTPLDKKWRVFERQNLVPRAAVAFPSTDAGRQAELNRLVPALAAPDANPTLTTVLRRITAIVTENFAPAYVVVNREGEVIYYSSRTGKYLEPAEGPPNRDLVTMARKGLRLDLRAVLNRVRETGETATVDNISVQVNGGSQLVRLTVMPVTEGGETLYIVLFGDLGPASDDDKPMRPPEEAEDGTIRQLERELQTTKERLQSTIEEFDTSSEELKSSNEELLSVNEELQSANEELETSKEEIQSINEELQTVNAELSNKVEELDRANGDLKNLFESTQVATIIVDNNLLIRSFTPAAIEPIFSLIPSDRGRPLTDIVSRLDEAQDLHRQLRAAIDRGQAVERRVVVQGRNLQYLMRILPYRMSDKQMYGALITFVDITNVIRAEEHERVLVAELNHRVHDMLGTVISITTNTRKRAKTLDDFELSDNLLDRFNALARTHAVLSKTRWIDMPIAELIAAEIASYTGPNRRKAHLQGPDVALVPKTALALGMALHELAANSASQGALSVPRGRVDIEWLCRGTRSAPSLELCWSERGGPPVGTGKKRPVFDLAYVGHELQRELGGKTKLDFHSQGLRCTIRIPVAENVSGTRRRKD